MELQENPAGKAGSEVIAGKRFQVVIEIEAAYHYFREIHPDDVQAVTALRDLLLSDEETFTKFMLCHSMDALYVDFPKVLMQAGFHEDAAAMIAESKARLLPREDIVHLMDLYQAGLGFANEAVFDATHCNITQFTCIDKDQAREVKIDAEPKPLFYRKNTDGCLLTQTATEWLAMLEVRLNSKSKEANLKAFGMAESNIDQIQFHQSASDLPLKEIFIGFIIADQADYEPACARLEQYAREKLPDTTCTFWFRQEDPPRSLEEVTQ